MKNKDLWIYGEFVRKRWGVNELTLETFALHGLPAYDDNNERYGEADGQNYIDTYRFKMEDIEKFERENAHLFRIKANYMNPSVVAESIADDEPGKRMTAKEVADLLNVDVKTVYDNYHKLGGMRLGRRYVFFERSVNNAISKREKMGSPSEEEWGEAGEGISDEEGSVDVGSQNEAKTRQRVEREDRHNLFG
jgi:hypothetical protein